MGVGERGRVSNLAGKLMQTPFETRTHARSYARTHARLYARTHATGFTWRGIDLYLAPRLQQPQVCSSLHQSTGEMPWRILRLAQHSPKQQISTVKATQCSHYDTMLIYCVA